MTTIRQILAGKPEIYAIGPEATVLDALRLMEEKNIGALLVMSGEQLLGIFSERDYARRMILQGRTSRETPVREVMTSNVFVITPDATSGECMMHMTDRRIRHLPVVEGARVVGVISIGDVVRGVIHDLRFTVHQLESYIKSGG
jgi:CBS domain-containing protein